MGVNNFGPRQTNIQHETPNYEPGKSQVEVDYYRNTYFSSENSLISEKPGIAGQEIMYYSKGFNSNYMDFVGYEKCEN